MSSSVSLFTFQRSQVGGDCRNRLARVLGELDSPRGLPPPPDHPGMDSVGCFPPHRHWFGPSAFLLDTRMADIFVDSWEFVRCPFLRERELGII